MATKLDKELDDLLEEGKPENPVKDEPKTTKKDKPGDSTDEAIDEIEAEEKVESPEEDDSPPEEPLIVEKGENKLKKLLKSKKFWVTAIFMLLAAVAILWFIRPIRILAVNLFGQRTTLHITTTTPAEKGRKSTVIKNATVKVNGIEHKTDKNGHLQLDMPYGEVEVVAEKQGFATTSHHAFLDYDPFFYYLGGREQDEKTRHISMQLKSVGVEILFKAQSWLTGKPLSVGEFSIGDVSGQPNEKGEVSIKIPATDAKAVQVKAVFNGDYANKKFNLNVKNEKIPTVTFAPAGKHYFISNRSGQYAVYSSNMDGSGVQQIVKASAEETGDIAFTASPSGDYGMLASTREGSRDGRGNLLQKMYLYNTSSKKLTPYDEATRFKFIDWSGDTLVYVAEITNPSTGQTTSRLTTHNSVTGKRSTLSTAISYSVGRVSAGSVVYLAKNNDNPQSELRVANLNGGSDKNLGFNVIKLSQTAHDRFAYQTNDQNWHEYNLNADKITNIEPPASTVRAYLAASSVNGQTRLAVDRIDGKLSLVSQSVASGKFTNLFASESINQPVTWVGNVAVFRIIDDSQSADYVVSTAGGPPKKISDATMGADNSDGYFWFN